MCECESTSAAGRTHLLMSSSPMSRMHAPMMTAMVSTMAIATQLGRFEMSSTMSSIVLPPVNAARLVKETYTSAIFSNCCVKNERWACRIRQV